MAGAADRTVNQDASEAALKEFEEGLARSIKQYKEGSINTFKTKEELLNHLKNLE